MLVNTLSTLFIAVSLSSIANAEMRSWKNSDGTKSFQAEFVSRDGTQISLRRSDGSELTFDIDKLHLDEHKFLEENHPITPPESQKELTGNAFGPLDFGDTRTEVEKKLLASSAVKTNVDETLFGRTGLNGIFETAQSMGSLRCFLYFGWSKTGNLEEVTLRSKGLGADSYLSTLQSTWNELIELLNTLHGKPSSISPYPKQEKLESGSILNSHLWRTSNGHSVLLGVGQQLAEYNVSIRITTKRIQPVALP